MVEKNPRVHPVDVHVGSRLRQRRRALGMSQQQLARMADMSFQQLQKYEKGHNQLSASKLYTFAALLGVSVAYFYAGLSESEMEVDSPDVPDTLETQILARNLNAIQDPKVRQDMYTIMTSLAARLPTEENQD